MCSWITLELLFLARLGNFAFRSLVLGFSEIGMGPYHAVGENLEPILQRVEGEYHGDAEIKAGWFRALSFDRRARFDNTHVAKDPKVDLLDIKFSWWMDCWTGSGH